MAALVEIHSRGQQVRFDEALRGGAIFILLEQVRDERASVAFEAFGEHARHAEARVNVIRVDGQCLAEKAGRVGVLMRGQVEPAPAHSRTNSAFIVSNDVAEDLVRAIDVAQRPGGFGLHEAVFRR